MSDHKPECDAKWEFDHDHCICKWIKQAEQRIIKLLREHFDDTALWRQIEWSPDVYQGFNKQELIQLIKGQNK